MQLFAVTRGAPDEVDRDINAARADRNANPRRHAGDNPRVRYPAESTIIRVLSSCAGAGLLGDVLQPGRPDDIEAGDIVSQCG
jgi:hypothetical protein